MVPRGWGLTGALMDISLGWVRDGGSSGLSAQSSCFHATPSLIPAQHLIQMELVPHLFDFFYLFGSTVLSKPGSQAPARAVAAREESAGSAEKETAEL